MDVSDHVDDPFHAWLGVAIGAVAALIIGSLAFPARVYEGFIWRYFWGPVHADALGARCASLHEGVVTEHFSASACNGAAGIVVTPGYTTLSTVSYMIVLLFAIVGIVLLMDRLEIGADRDLFYALIPYVFLGGVLRVVEDANALLSRDYGEMVVGLPWMGFLISPLIYFTVFTFAALALLFCLWLADREVIDRYHPTYAAIGIVALLASVGVLVYLRFTTDIMDVTPAVALISLGGAALITGIVWVLTERYWPEVNEWTGPIGAVIIWGHTVDGIANVLSLDWGHTLDLPRSYEPKHIVNEAIHTTTSAIQPAWLTDAIGTAWPFLPVKVIAAVIVVWIFNDEIFEDSPNFAMLMLIAVFAVGLGPGTRDFLRATLGI